MSVSTPISHASGVNTAGVPVPHNSGEVAYLSHVDRPYSFTALTGERVCVCLAEFSNVRRYRDFCRVEASVRVVFQLQPALEVRVETFLTSVPFTPASENGTSYRQKLIRSAVNLALLTRANDVEGLLRTA